MNADLVHYFSYVHGIMDGEVMEDVSIGKRVLQDIIMR